MQIKGQYGKEAWVILKSEEANHAYEVPFYIYVPSLLLKAKMPTS